MSALIPDYLTNIKCVHFVHASHALTQLHSHRPLVLVMAYDFQKEKFNLRLPSDDIDKIPEAVVKVGQALWQHKVKLSATLAKMRVKENAQSISDLIPDTSIRERYQASMNQPCYARVNTNKVKDVQEEVIFPLQSMGYTEVTTREQLQQQKRAVRHTRRDLLEFSVDCRGTLDCIDLVKDGIIILQVELRKSPLINVHWKAGQ